MEHTFVICAYKESPYLEDCIRSLKKQTVQSHIIMATSTPNDYIRKMAEQYEIPLYISGQQPDIVSDWNYGLSNTKTPYVTIAHQDDIYLPEYTRHVMRAFKGAAHPLIFFCDYGELRGDKVVINNKLLNIKRLMLLPLRMKALEKSIFVRRRILSFGSPICCPSVAYAKWNLPEVVFEKGFRSNEDWQAWERISKLKGEFLFDKEVLMYHRIHEESETSSIIRENKRSSEDMEMYSKFWPKPVAKLLVKLYASGQKSNDLNT